MKIFTRLSVSVALALVAGLGAACSQDAGPATATTKPSGADRGTSGQAQNGENTSHTVRLSEPQLEHIAVLIVETRAFGLEKSAPGRIAFSEDSTTSIFTPYSGHVLRLFAKTGDRVQAGSPLFQIDTPDLVQANSDVITAYVALEKARNQLELARRTAERQADLYRAKAVAQKDWEQAQSDLRNAEHDLRAAEGMHSAARDKLRVFGKTDAEIHVIETERRIDRVTQVPSPIAGTITTRKVGPGQFVKPDNPDPLFTIANTSTMWLLANVYETDIAAIHAGQPVEVQVLAYPTQTFRARITYVAEVVDPATHRIAVRAEIANPEGTLKPEMFASFRILTSASVPSPAIPLSAVTRDGEQTTVWVKSGPREFTRRTVKLGLERDGFIQTLSGVRTGEQVVIRGGVFLSNVGQGA